MSFRSLQNSHDLAQKKKGRALHLNPTRINQCHHLLHDTLSPLVSIRLIPIFEKVKTNKDWYEVQIDLQYISPPQ